jgi:hypothetical protein
MSEQPDSKYSFGRASYNPEISSMNKQEWRHNKRQSDLVRDKYRFSQGGSYKPAFGNFTEDDVGDEGITELFNYLSDTESEGTKQFSNKFRK